MSTTASDPVTFVTANGKHVVVPWHEGLANTVPHAREFLWQGARMLLMPNDMQEARIARNLGVAVPAPILTRYDWCNSKPWEIQRTTAALLTESPRCYVLNEMGTGKTRSVLYALDYMLQSKQATRILIIAPLSTLTPVWEKEIFHLMLKRYPVSVLYGSRTKRLKLLEEGAPICITNHHGLKVFGVDEGNALLRAGFDVIVIDELAVFRTRRTDLWKYAKLVIDAPSTRYVWGLTGSPTPNAPTDAWAQVRLLTPARVDRTFTAFKDRTMRQVSNFRWLPRPEANALVTNAMSPAVRYTRDDVMELPACSVVERATQLEGDTAKAYKMLYDKARMMNEKGEVISAVNEGVLHNKLLQVSCGFLYTDKHTVYAMPVTKRLAALEEALDETDRKCLVLVPFLHALTGVATHLRSTGHDIAVVHGGTTRTTRDKIFSAFQMEASPRTIVAHPQVLSHGLTLTQANTIIWYSPTLSNEIYEQANARINRPGQQHKTLIVHMVGTPIEQTTYRRLAQKQRMQNCLLDLFKQQKVAF